MEKVLDDNKELQIEKDNQYNRKLQLNKKENDILLQQLEKYLVYKEKFEAFEKEKNEEIEKLTDEFDKQAKTLEKSRQNEQEIAGKYQKISKKFDTVQDEVQKLPEIRLIFLAKRTCTRK